MTERQITALGTVRLATLAILVFCVAILYHKNTLLRYFFKNNLTFFQATFDKQKGILLEIGASFRKKDIFLASLKYCIVQSLMSFSFIIFTMNV